MESAEGATLTQVAALRALTPMPLSVSELARVLGVHRSSASRLVDRLVGGGWVTREPAAHSGREVIVALTDPGRALSVRVARSRKRALKRLISVVPTEAQEGLARQLVTFLELARPRHG